jgi:serine protease Do
MKLTAIGIAALVGLSACAENSHNDTSSVKIVLEKGHGSATHIGGGFFVTAAHVVKDNETVVIQTSSGRAGVGDVLWANVQYDIALVRSDIDGVSESYLSCTDAMVGDAVVSRGNPMDMENIETVGRVASFPMAVADTWKEVFVYDGAMGPGMSGGGAFSSSGDLVGVNVGAPLMQSGMGVSFIGLAYMVPSSVVCMLMGR